MPWVKKSNLVTTNSITYNRAETWQIDSTSQTLHSIKISAPQKRLAYRIGDSTFRIGESPFPIRSVVIGQRCHWPQQKRVRCLIKRTLCRKMNADYIFVEVTASGVHVIGY